MFTFLILLGGLMACFLVAGFVFLHLFTTAPLFTIIFLTLFFAPPILGAILRRKFTPTSLDEGKP